MGVLRIDHPDIMDFISAKQDQSKFNNFNFSVAITDAFMQAVEDDGDYDLIERRPKRSLPPERPAVFDKIVDLAWHNGEPASSSSMPPTGRT